MNKAIVLSLFCSFTLLGCTGPSVEANAEIPTFEAAKKVVIPNLKTMLTNQNVNGYTKKTILSDEICSHIDYFHYGCNTPKRATYYNVGENALLMGEYDGGFDDINSGYKNLPDEVDGIQHFTYVGSGDYFSEIKEDWSYLGQKVGTYYPILFSLSELINQEEDWSYSDETFTYLKEDAKLLKNFQFFAAPMLLEGKVELKTVKIKLVSEELSIELVDKTDAVVSTAKVTKGY